MDTKIEQIPKIPQGLRDAAQQGVLIPFVGAGASRLAGSPGWDGFADGALCQLIGRGRLSYAEVEQLRGLSPRVKLSLARAFGERFNQDIKYSELLRNNSHQKKIGDRLYTALARLGKTFVTTNYDEWLDDMIIQNVTGVTRVVGQSQSTTAPEAMRVVYKAAELTYANLDCPYTVIHLHGSVKDPDNMILTTGDYVRHYANDRNREENQVLTFLNNLFTRRTVLFVGYGLEEHELLEQIIIKERPASGIDGISVQHYLLQGFFSHELKLMEHLSSYYMNECGIELLPFLRDDKDHEQLVDVLENFAEQTPASSPMVLQELIDMEHLLQ